jgi:hypothetical protein
VFLKGVAEFCDNPFYIRSCLRAESFGAKILDTSFCMKRHNAFCPAKAPIGIQQSPKTSIVFKGGRKA